MADDDDTPLAGDDEPYKYRVNKSEDDSGKQKSSEQTYSGETDDEDNDEFVNDAIQNFVTDSLWSATLNPETVDTTESSNKPVPEKNQWVDTTDYRDDMLYMREDTSTAEVIEFMRRCIENPIEAYGKVVWNFSTHEIDEEAIEGLQYKNKERFVIPYQVTGAWGFMFSVLPQEIREAEILVYDPAEEKYMAYRSLYRTTADERIEQVRQDLSRRMVSESGETLGLRE